MTSLCKPLFDKPGLTECEGGWLVPDGWVVCDAHKSARCPAVYGERLHQYRREFLRSVGFGAKYQNPDPTLLFGGGNAPALALNGIHEYWANIETNIKIGYGFLLCGTVGTGKTFALALTALKTQWPKSDVKYITSPDLFDLLHTRNAEAEDYKNCSLLLLDEFGGEYSTQWNSVGFNAFVEYRHANELATCIVSNQSAKALSGNKLFTRVMDRWRDTCNKHVYELSFPSLRGR